MWGSRKLGPLMMDTIRLGLIIMPSTTEVAGFASYILTIFESQTNNDHSPWYQHYRILENMLVAILYREWWRQNCSVKRIFLKTPEMHKCWFSSDVVDFCQGEQQTCLFLFLARCMHLQYCQALHDQTALDRHNVAYCMRYPFRHGCRDNAAI